MDDKTAVITGATSGIGAAYARAFAGMGYDLIITGRRREKIEGFAETIRRQYGRRVDVVLAELSDPADVRTLARMIGDREVDVLVNNAGFGYNSLFQDCDITIMEQLVKVNIEASMSLIRTVLPGMVSRGRGTVINISSEATYIAIPKNSVYAGAKAFVKVFTEGLALDLWGTGVRVQVVCPGLTRTDFHEKMGMERSRQTDHGLIKWMQPDDIVAESLRDLNKGKVICIPGRHTRRLIRLLCLLPRKAYYRTMIRFSRKSLSKPKMNTEQAV